MAVLSNVCLYLGYRSHTRALPQILKSCPELLAGGKPRGKTDRGNQKGKVESRLPTHDLGAIEAFARVLHRQQTNHWLQRNSRRRGRRRGQKPGWAGPGSQPRAVDPSEVRGAWGAVGRCPAASALPAWVTQGWFVPCGEAPCLPRRRCTASRLT